MSHGRGAPKSQKLTKLLSDQSLSMDEQTARRDLIRICHLMYERSYVVSSDGNVSVQLDDGRVLATPTMTCKGRMTDDLIAETDLEGRPLNERRASSELAMHLLIYRERPDVKAVCHAHPPHGTAFAVAGLPIDQPILSEVILTLGCVPLAEYGTPSTQELTDAMRPLVKYHNALLMANHGAVAYGADLWQAWDRLETLEHTAKIAIRHRRVCFVLPNGRRAALPRRQRAQPRRPRISGVARVLQRARKHDHVVNRTREEWLSRTAQSEFLGRGQRVLGLRR